jgi:prophage antirepressor-like protein
VDGKPYAVGVDVARALDYAKPSQAVIDHCKGIRKLGIPSAGGLQETNVIPEGDIYRLIIKAADQSRNPDIKAKAARFESWVFDDVLPSIRQHGIYATGQVIDQILSNPDYGIRLLTELKAEQEQRKRLEVENAQQKQIIGELQPKASYYDLILQSKSIVPITKIAKDYGMSGKAMNSLLHELGIQYRMGNTWLLYQKYAEMGYTQSKTHAIDADKSVLHTYWTQKGRLFLYDLLKNARGLLPLIEQQEKSA